jgi:hypothetical protein
LLILLVFPYSYDRNIKRLKKQNNSYLLEVADYIKNISEENESFIRPGTVHKSTSVLSLYSDRASFPAEKIIDFKDFSLLDYDIKYVLVYEDDKFDYINSIINSQDIDSFSEELDRSELINQKISNLESTITTSGDYKIKIEDDLEYLNTINGIEIYRVKR